VPGDGLAFAVQVGGEVDLGGFLGQLLQLADDLALAALLDDDVLGLEGLEVDAIRRSRGFFRCVLPSH
jgi:hypothetical protein